MRTENGGRGEEEERGGVDMKGGVWVEGGMRGGMMGTGSGKKEREKAGRERGMEEE